MIFKRIMAESVVVIVVVVFVHFCHAWVSIWKIALVHHSQVNTVLCKQVNNLVLYIDKYINIYRLINKKICHVFFLQCISDGLYHQVLQLPPNWQH